MWVHDVDCRMRRSTTPQGFHLRRREDQGHCQRASNRLTVVTHRPCQKKGACHVSKECTPALCARVERFQAATRVAIAFCRRSRIQACLGGRVVHSAAAAFPACAYDPLQLVPSMTRPKSACNSALAAPRRRAMAAARPTCERERGHVNVNDDEQLLTFAVLKRRTALATGKCCSQYRNSITCDSIAVPILRTALI